MIFDNEKFRLRWVNEHTLILSTKGADASLKPGLFIAHMDVVPANAEEWNSDPFEPKVADGYIQVYTIVMYSIFDQNFDFGPKFEFVQNFDF